MRYSKPYGDLGSAKATILEIFKNDEVTWTLDSYRIMRGEPGVPVSVRARLRVVSTSLQPPEIRIRVDMDYDALLRMSEEELGKRLLGLLSRRLP